MSKPRSLSRFTRSLMRQRSAVENDSEPVSSFHRLRYASTMPFGDAHGVELVGDAAAGLEVEELAGDVDACDLEVVLALAVREAALVELARLGIDEVGGERARVATEQRVRQRHVAPEEPDDVQPHEQHGERVDQARRGVGPQRLREQRAIGQRERRCRVTSTGFSASPSASVRFVMTATGSTQGISMRCSMRSISYSPLAISAVVSLIATTCPREVGEAHEVPRDALGQGRDGLARPRLERELPRQVEQCRIGHGRGDRK